MRGLKKLLLVTGVATIVTAGGVSASSYTYSAYALRAFCANNYTGTHKKSTNNSYVKNSVIAVTSAAKPNFWVEALKTSGGYQQISGEYIQKKGSDQKLYFLQKYKSQYGKKGKSVRLGMENDALSTTTGFVTGKVDFR